MRFLESQELLLSSPSRCSARIRSWLCTFLSSHQWFSCFSAFFHHADDLAIWSSFPRVPAAMVVAQGALIRLERCSEYWRLPLNLSKCEASFSVDSYQANLQPNLLLLNSRLRFNPTPTFLGVTFDHTLSFSKHGSLLKAKFFLRLKVLRCISASSWGPSKVRSPSFFSPFTFMLPPDDFIS